MTIQELADKAEVTTRTIRYYVEQGVLPPPGYGRPAEYTEEHVERLALIKRLKEQYLPLEEIRDTVQHLTLAEIEQLMDDHSFPPQEIAQQQKLGSASDYLNNVLGRGVAREQLKRKMPPAWDESEAKESESSPASKPEDTNSGFALQEAPGPYADLDLMTSLPAFPVSPPSMPAPASAIAPGVPPSPARERSAEVNRPEPEGSATGGKKSAYIKSPSPMAKAEQSSEVDRLSTTWERVNLGDGVELHYPTGADASTRGKVARLIEAARRILGRNPGNGE